MPSRSRSGICASLIDLPENVIVSILRCLPTASKCKAQLVCKRFKDILCQPSPGVWDGVDLDVCVFEKVTLPALIPCASYSTSWMNALFSNYL